MNSEDQVRAEIDQQFPHLPVDIIDTAVDRGTYDAAITELGYRLHRFERAHRAADALPEVIAVMLGTPLAEADQFHHEQCERLRAVIRRVRPDFPWASDAELDAHALERWESTDQLMTLMHAFSQALADETDGDKVCDDHLHSLAILLIGQGWHQAPF